MPPVTLTFTASVTAMQTWKVPEGVSQIQFDVWGASGYGGGLGGRVQGTLTVAPESQLDIWVGYAGSVPVPGFSGVGGLGGWGGQNGARRGGNGGNSRYLNGDTTYAGGGGGGATEIDLDGGTVPLVIGGGGGGAGKNPAVFGHACGEPGVGGCGARPPFGSTTGGFGVDGTIGYLGPANAGGGGGNGAGGAAGSPNGQAGTTSATGAGGSGGSDPLNASSLGGGGGGGGYGGGGGGGSGDPALYTAGGGGSGRSIGPAVGATFGTTPSLGDGKVTLTYTPPTAPAASTRFVPLPPVRLLDTRLASDVTAGRPLAPGAGIDLQVTGRGGVPATNVAAVVLNVTVADAGGPGYVTVWPAREDRPTVSNLNVTVAGQNIANLVTVRLGSNGMVSLYSQSGANLIADVSGYYEPVDGLTSAGRYTPTAPSRILDTQSSIGVPGTLPIPPNSSIDLLVSGRGGVPASGVSAVVLNVTVADASAIGFVTVWPAGTPRPTASTLNVTFPQQNIANLVIVPLGTGGSISLYTQGGGRLVADVAGWFGDSTQPAGLRGLFTPLTPARILDTRSAIGVVTTTPLATDTSIVLTVAGHGGAPATGISAAVINVTATAAAAPGYITVWPADRPQPTASTLNATSSGQDIANLASVALSATGTISMYTQSGTHLIADLAGYYAG